jgi:DNA polymerase-3 subunit delta'
MEYPLLPAISVPMPWQDDTWQHMRAQIDKQQLPHALLLAGSEFTGKNRLAMALARLLLCSSPIDGHNCGNCHPCEMSQAGSHGDMQFVHPEGKSRVISVKQIRDIVEFGHKTAGYGSRKVVLFTPAESMNISSANALLKSLEEPPANTYMLLVSHRPHGLPATVRSRCQQFRLPIPSVDESLPWLDQLTGDREASVKLLDISDGRPMLAQKIFQGGDTEVITAIPAALDSLRTGRAPVPAVAALLGKLGIDEALAQFATYLQRILRSEGSGGTLNPQSRLVFVLLDEVRRMQGAVSSGANPNPQLLLESLLARYQMQLGRT